MTPTPEPVRDREGRTERGEKHQATLGLCGYPDMKEKGEKTGEGERV